MARTRGQRVARGRGAGARLHGRRAPGFRGTIPRWATNVTALFVALDLGLYGFTAGALDTSRLQDYVAATAAPPTSEGRVVAGYDALKLRHGDRVLLAGATRRWLRGPRTRARLDYQSSAVERVAGVRYRRVANSPDSPPEWQAASPPLERARLLARLWVGSPPPTLAGIAIDRLATVEQPLEIDAGSPGAARVLSDTPGRIVVDTEAPGRQLLALDEAFDAGWRATIDGRPANAVRVYGDFLGVVAPRGKHRVELKFAPESVRLGRLASFAGLGLLAVGVCLAAATGNLTGGPAASSRARRTAPRGAVDLAATSAALGTSSATYLDENPYVRIPKL